MISGPAASVLVKLYRQEELSETENNLEVTTSEVAAIWSIVNGRAVSPKYVREVKRDGRIIPSREWGKGPALRSLYRVKGVKDIVITDRPGRHKKQAPPAV